jgi:hypothetical protein
MTDNLSLSLSVAFKGRLNSNLLPAFAELIPTAVIEEYVKTHMPKTNSLFGKNIFTPKIANLLHN